MSKSSPLLPGRPASSYLKLTLYAWAALILGFGLLLLRTFLGLTDAASLAVAVIVSVPAAVATITGFVLAQRRSTLEAAAGYTTLKSVRQELEQRHPVSGRVIRPAGAPFVRRSRVKASSARS